MYSLCDTIERYIMRLIESSPDQVVTIQRGKLASEFDCAPSQINYVLATRFSVFRGFIVESRRGGSGYVRIRKIPIDRIEPIVAYLEEYERQLKESDVEDLLSWLERENFITHRESELMKAAMIKALEKVDDLGIPPGAERNQLRSRILREMLLQILSWGK
ncbi:MAG: CtsR family transcriptional regulator [Candidatus Caldatribacterium sp.]|uniref:CtsR family transcriptional regulator n=1 Tax=Candidatus Caldatribacterium sp. TaxID=2282143 RepID=UPI00299347E8|nr:CtsR family transcriptional regulator [Candidatus Caldatribacterium sp.]MCX7731218.1 CtsR family transcriptional regulator [Candidatus Caldatribacterium sp.]MDW8080302.1 CtsR family transcriptional regulator [Candidatus Calescibacterium sp.]